MKKILLLIMIMCGSIGCMADYPTLPDSVTAPQVFMRLPLKTLDLLSVSSRMDMVDFFKVDSVYKATNSMGGESFLRQLSPEYLSICLTPVTEMSITMLPYKKGKLVMTTYTIGDNDEAFDTDLEFFDAGYNELPREKFIRIPELEDFFNIPDKKVRDRIEELIPFPTVKYMSDPSKGTLTAVLTNDQIISKDDMNSIKQYLKGALTYKWNGKRFELRK